jgi:hypothetical protein
MKIMKKTRYQNIVLDFKLTANRSYNQYVFFSDFILLLKYIDLGKKLWYKTYLLFSGIFRSL